MPIAPPPATVSVPAPPAPDRSVEVGAFMPEVTCAGSALATDRLVPPRPVVITRFGPRPNVSAPTSYRFSFAIDGQGRPMTIRRSGTVPYPGGYIDTSDLAPSLAASRFAAGAPRSGCSATYGVGATPIASAPLPLLYELASMRETSSTRELWDRVRPVWSDCTRGPGQYRSLNLPAFEKLPQPPGTASWVFLAYDVDRAGRTRAIRILGTSGNAALDRAGVRALAGNRYAPGPGYRGCTYHFGKTQPSDATSPDYPPGTPADNGEQPGCQVDPKSIAGLLNGSAYPRNFSRRRVEGVAVVGYDTAPWGAVGNAKVIVSEPDEAFGEAARAALSNARVAESDTGRRGCIRHIRFKLPPT